MLCFNVIYVYDMNNKYWIEWKLVTTLTYKFYQIQHILYIVPMVLNPHGIEPTFLELNLWSPGAGCIPIITYNVLN